VAHPQIAMFARLAKGAQPPVRTLYGQASHLSRTMHDIRYDGVHDELVVPVPYAQAIVTFRGGADGQEAPIRTIQGPKTGSIGSRLDVDPVHNEIFTYSGTENTVTVYAREANGDVAPIRVIKGPNTQIKRPYGIAVDPVNDLLVVGLNSNFGTDQPIAAEDTESLEKGALLIFNRTDNGNVKPKAVIRGPKSGIIRINQIQLYPQRRLIVADMPGDISSMLPGESFIGIWSYDDNGDIPPKWKIPGDERTTLKKPLGVALNPKNKELIVSDLRNQGVLVFSVPEIF
jgi:DNA-binding beta-propeller fold protein YncE